MKHEDSDWHTCAGRRPMVSAPAYWQASPMMIPNTPEAAASQNKCSDGSHRSPITRQKMPSTTLASGCRMSMTAGIPTTLEAVVWTTHPRAHEKAVAIARKTPNPDIRPVPPEVLALRSTPVAACHHLVRAVSGKGREAGSGGGFRIRMEGYEPSLKDGERAVRGAGDEKSAAPSACHWRAEGLVVKKEVGITNTSNDNGGKEL